MDGNWGTRTNSPAPPDSVVLHQATVGLHGEEAGRPTFGGLTVGEVLLEGAGGFPRDQLIGGGGREDGGLGLHKLREITRVANHGNVVHVELSLRLVLESFDETLGRHVCVLILNRVEGVWRGQDTFLTCPSSRFLYGRIHLTQSRQGPVIVEQGAGSHVDVLGRPGLPRVFFHERTSIEAGARLFHECFDERNREPAGDLSRPVCDGKLRDPYGFVVLGVDRINFIQK